MDLTDEAAKAIMALRERAQALGDEIIGIRILDDSPDSPEDADPADEMKPSRYAFFLCLICLICRVADRPDRLPWYTSGFI